MDEKLKLSSREQRQIDTLTDELHFRELTAMASEVCFGRELTFEKYQIPDTETARVLANLGVRGLRSMLESEYDVYPALDRQITGEPAYVDGYFVDECLDIDSTYRMAGLGDRPNVQAIYEAKQFGKELLSSAYKCLGSDVYEKINDFTTAESFQERAKVFVWLYIRLMEMADQDVGLEDNEEGVSAVYHPIRLSPRAIGVYPNNHVPPTCLGVSVIAASFFEQAGAEHLQAGVMETSGQAVLKCLISNLSARETITSLKNRLSKNPAVLDKVFGKMETLVDLTTEDLVADNGYHAANLIKIQESDGWLLFDPNFRNIHIVGGISNEEIDKANANLIEYEQEAPGLEVSVSMGVAPSVGSMEMFVPKLLNMPEPELDDAEFRSIFVEEDESVVEKLKSSFMDAIDKMIESTPKNESDIYDIEIMRRYGHEMFEKSLDSYVLWDEPIYDVQARCRLDENYLDRRMSDMKSLWAAMAPAIITRYSEAVLDDVRGDSHTLMEVGLSAQRIGLSVLKDFDDYCGGDISPSFWTSNWPSQIPVVDSIARPNSRAGQDVLANSLAHSMQASNLLYTKTHGILRKFFSDYQGDSHEQGQPD